MVFLTVVDAANISGATENYMDTNWKLWLNTQQLRNNPKGCELHAETAITSKNQVEIRVWVGEDDGTKAIVWEMDPSVAEALANELMKSVRKIRG